MSCGCPLRKDGSDHVCIASCKFRGCSGACRQARTSMQDTASVDLGGREAPRLSAGSTFQPLGSRSFNLQELQRQQPLRFKCGNKAYLYDEVQRRVRPPPENACLHFHRVRAGQLPRRFKHCCSPTVLPGGFDYAQSSETTAHWYLNFADAKLFGFFEGTLFAQDEWQVQEHPALGSLRRALLAAAEQSLAPLTVEGGVATPCLIVGVPRVCSIDTSSSSAAPAGLYGNAFAHASHDAVLAAAVFHDDPALVSNILAIEAPKCRGTYTFGTVKRILEAACSGYAAARGASQGATEVLLHTSHWGCGAFGGSRPLMAMLQVVAAQLAGVSLVYHSFDVAGAEAVEQGLQALHALEERLDPDNTGEVSLDAFIREVEASGFQWGQSDGN